ncbi:MAG: LytTR family DNA-binding domain-containing protein [Verrucomicrobiae bacterium]
MKTVLVVEDEMVALEDLRDSLLEIDPALEIVGVQTAMEGLELMGNRKSDNPKRFDGIFLDLELPGMSGIQMIERMGPAMPPVVLVTAHAMMALDAIGMGVIGCLLKPVDQQRLRRAYQQMKTIAEAPPKSAAPADELIPGPESRVLLRDRNGIHMVNVLDFSLLSDEHGSTRIFFGDHSVVVPHSLAEMETSLDREHFFRVNATTIVNLNKVVHYTTSPTGLFVAGLPDGTAAEFSPERSRIFQTRFEL